METTTRTDRSPSLPGASQRLLRWVTALIVLVTAGGLTVIGWQWVREIPLEEIRVEPASMVAADEILALADVDTTRRLFEIQPAEVAAAVARHPWVSAVEVTRIPTGVLKIAVRQRAPVALTIGAEGRPGYYLDAEGRRLSPRKGAAFNVPLLRGLGHRAFSGDTLTVPVVREMLIALAGSDEETRALISEIAYEPQKGLRLVTEPTRSRRSVEVDLGSDDLSDRLGRLRAFWEQAVLTRPDTEIREIDLRFDSQIVVRGKPS